MSSMHNPGMVTDLTALNQYISGYGNNSWLMHSDKLVSDDLFVVPGPLTLEDLPKYTVSIQQNTYTVNVKCHSSRPIVDTESTDDLTIEPTTKVCVTVAVYNTSNTPQTLSSGIIGDIHVSNNDTATKFQTAATDTAEQLAENVTAFLSNQAVLHQKAAKTVAKALFENVLAMHGCPKRLMSDSGMEFFNAIIMELSEILSIKKVYTNVYRPLANGATEGMHRFLNDSMSMYVSKFVHEWDMWLHAATFVHNTSVISVTDNLTLFFLVYG